MTTRRMLEVAKPLAGLAMVLGFWQYWATVRSPGSLVLPPPTDVVEFMVNNKSLLLRNAWSTLKVVLIGFSISLTLGVLVALVFEISKTLRDMFLPLFVVTQVTPVIAVAPLFVIALGFGDPPKIAVVVLISFFPVLVNTLTGLRDVPTDVQQVARGVDGPRWRQLALITLPNAVPYIFSGAAIAITLAVIGAVVGEFVASDAGLGHVILQGSAHLRPEQMWAAVMSLAVLGLALFNLVRLAEYLAVPWKRVTRPPNS